MTKHRSTDVRIRGERGTALVGVLLLLLMMSALGAAMAVSGQTETLIARNQLSAEQAQAAAEAGLNHALAVTVGYIFDWQINGFASSGLGVAAAVDSVLTSADTGTFQGMSLNTLTSIKAGFTAQYEVDILDDDADGVGEDGDPLNDVNDVLVVRSTGYAQDGTKVVLEALISPVNYPAILTNGDLEIGGNVSVQGGDDAGVHANGDLEIDGSAEIDGNASAAGDLDCDDPCDAVDGTATEGAPEIAVPDVNASDYYDRADYVLASDGTLKDRATGTVLCTAGGKTECNGWEWDGSGTWSTTDPDGGTYYVEGHVTMNGGGPVDLTIIAEGSIDIEGGVDDVTPDTDGLLFVTDEDLEINGNLDTEEEAQILVRGQIAFHGNATIQGQLIVENEPVGDLVESNTILGNVVIEYTGSLETGAYEVTSWRDVRDAD